MLSQGWTSTRLHPQNGIVPHQYAIHLPAERCGGGGGPRLLYNANGQNPLSSTAKFMTMMMRNGIG